MHRFSQTVPAKLVGLQEAASAEIKPLPATAIDKPSKPTIPAAPAGLPSGYDFCVQENGMILRARNTSHPLHGKQVQGSCFLDEDTGLRMCSFDVGGDVSETVPACIDEAKLAPIPPACCVDVSTSTLVCPSSPYHGLMVSMVPGSEFEHDGVAGISVEHESLPGGGARVNICKTFDPVPCCIDDEEGILICESGELARFHGFHIDKKYYECAVENGKRVCRIKCSSAAPQNEVEELIHLLCEKWGMSPVIPTCKQPKKGRIPGHKQPPPVLCCFDPTTSSLLCEGTPYHGLKVEVVSEGVLADGTKVVSVEHPLLPGGGLRAPLCEPPEEKIPPKTRLPPEEDIPAEIPEEPGEDEDVPSCMPREPRLPEGCCWNPIDSTLWCPQHPLHGVKVILKQRGAVYAGWPMVKIESERIPGREANVPVCPLPPAGPGKCNPLRNEEFNAIFHANFPNKTFGKGQGKRFGFSGRDPRGQHSAFDPKLSCFAKGERGWNPPMGSLQQGRLCPVPWGPMSDAFPPNISGDPAGFNKARFKNRKDVKEGFCKIGVKPTREGIKSFQAAYNRIAHLAMVNPAFQQLSWTRVPRGHVVKDGHIGPQTINALEIILENHKRGLDWRKLIYMAEEGGCQGQGRRHVYSAK